MIAIEAISSKIAIVITNNFNLAGTLTPSNANISKVNAISAADGIKSKPLKLERFGKNLVIWRDSGKIVTMENRCPHRGAELSLGRVCDNAIACPFHGFRFDQHGNYIFNPETQVAIPKLKIKYFQSKLL